MHSDHSVFLDSTHQKKRLSLRFYSKEDGLVLTRTCAAMDFGLSRRAKDKSDHYHLWDYDSDSARHILSLLPAQIVSLELTDTPFEPSEFITWDVKASPWFTKRDWGNFS